MTVAETAMIVVLSMSIMQHSVDTHLFEDCEAFSWSTGSTEPPPLGTSLSLACPSRSPSREWWRGLRPRRS